MMAKSTALNMATNFSALQIIQMPRSQAIQEGKKLVLSCRTRALLDIRYRWVKDDIEIPGANRSDLVLEPVRMRDFGSYACRVWDKSGAATSDSADIDVFPAPNMSKHSYIFGNRGTDNRDRAKISRVKPTAFASPVFASENFTPS